jgi:allantoin racemase
LAKSLVSKQRSIAWHIRNLRQLDLMDRLAGERPLELSVAESASEGTLPRMIEVGRALKEQDGANAIVMRRHGAPPQAAGGRARHSGD